jgi:hypothetical protein
VSGGVSQNDVDAIDGDSCSSEANAKRNGTLCRFFALVCALNKLVV